MVDQGAFGVKVTGGSGPPATAPSLGITTGAVLEAVEPGSFGGRIRHRLSALGRLELDGLELKAPPRATGARPMLSLVEWNSRPF